MKYLIAGIVMILLASCKQDTYYGAYSPKRYAEVEEGNKQYLAKANDLLLLVDDLSELAMRTAELRTTHMLAEDIQSTANELSEQLRFEARQRDIVVSDNLSPSNTQYLEELREKPEEQFDKAYFEAVSSMLSDIKELSKDYQKNGETTRLRDFAQNLETSMRNMLTQVDAAYSD